LGNLELKVSQDDGGLRSIKYGRDYHFGGGFSKIRGLPKGLRQKDLVLVMEQVPDFQKPTSNADDQIFIPHITFIRHFTTRKKLWLVRLQTGVFGGI